MRKKIENIDKNFQAKKIDGENIIYHNVLNKPFKLFGFPWIRQDNVFCRLPQKLLSQFNENLQQLAWHTSGGMVRFVTDSPFVAIKAELLSEVDMPHMAKSANSGFDFYVGDKKEQKFIGAAIPKNGGVHYSYIQHYHAKGKKLWTINFPLYNGVKEVFIGLASDSSFEEAPEFSVEKPIVFYGSSITQGACASRPGNAYTHYISRFLDANIVNLGFSGNAKGETEMAELIAKIDMSVFVMDYDHNAPNVDDLEKTHEPFFQIIRRANPALPVIFITRPDYDYNPYDNGMRKKVIYTTYLNAKNSGDRNVVFIDGEGLFGVTERDACTVDTVHPNDLGFYRMAEEIYPIIREALHL